MKNSLSLYVITLLSLIVVPVVYGDNDSSLSDDGVGNEKRELVHLYQPDMEEEVDKSIEQFSKAAELGSIASQLILAGRYELGEGVPQSDEQAFKWYFQAARNGNSRAQNNLGWMYMTGIGVKQNKSAAYAWYKIAAGNKAISRSARLLVANKMTNDQIEEGKQLAEKIQTQIYSYSMND